MCSHCPKSATGRKVSSGSGSRQLVMDCPVCPGMPLRAAFSSVTRCGYPVCGSCGSAYVFRCPGEHLAYCDARDDDPNRHPVLLACAGESDRSVPAIVRLPKLGRWYCKDCPSFVKGGSATCKRCGSTGPHTFGEEHATYGGNLERRARLRKDHKRRSGHIGPATGVSRPIPSSTDDIPF